MSVSLEFPTKANQTRVIAVTGGKGGVGKTTVSINLAVALAKQGQRVTLFDADLGLANCDVLLGLSPKRTMLNVLDGECKLQDILLEGPAGIKVVPAASGVQKMAELNHKERVGLMYAFSELGQSTDVLIVDTAAGIASNSLQFCEAAQEVLVVVCNDPASITDAYATIKVLHNRSQRHCFRVVVNMTHGPVEAIDLFSNLVDVTDRFLDISLDLAGTIPYDKAIPKAIRSRKALVSAYPESNAGLAFKKLAAMTDKWPVPERASGQLEFFVERMIQADTVGRPVSA